jgi:hypothetical protein
MVTLGFYIPTKISEGPHLAPGVAGRDEHLSVESKTWGGLGGLHSGTSQVEGIRLVLPQWTRITNDLKSMRRFLFPSIKGHPTSSKMLCITVFLPGW